MYIIIIITPNDGLPKFFFLKNPLLMHVSETGSIDKILEYFFYFTCDIDGMFQSKLPFTGQ